MAFPQYDIAVRGDDKFVLAKTDRSEAESAADFSESACEIMGVFESEHDARLQLLRILATPVGHPTVDDAQGNGRWLQAS